MPAEGTLEVRLRVVRRAFVLDVDFQVPPGITALFGPSGSGKSTSLAAISGLVHADEGRIALGGETWFDSKNGVTRAVHRRQVAYVFQSLALFPHMSARENVAYGVSRAVPKAERRARALAMLERMRVGHVAERRPETLSGGEAQRVALARAFAMQPRVMLLDEAFSAMDRDLRRELSQDVRRYIDEVKIPAIVVTHHRNEARAMADRVVLIEGGRITGTGSVAELLPMLPSHQEQAEPA